MESTLWFCFKCCTDDGPIITLTAPDEKPIRRICRDCILKSERLLASLLQKLKAVHVENNQVLVAGSLSAEDFKAVAEYLPEQAPEAPIC